MPKKRERLSLSFETVLTEGARNISSSEDKLEKHVKTERVDVKSMPVTGMVLSRTKTSPFEQAIRAPRPSVYYEATMSKEDVQHRRMLAATYRTNVKKQRNAK